MLPTFSVDVIYEFQSPLTRNLGKETKLTFFLKHYMYIYIIFP